MSLLNEAKEQRPHNPHFPSTKELLKKINRHRFAASVVSAAVLGLGGAYGFYSVVTGHAGDSNISNSPTNPATQPQKPTKSDGITLAPTPTVRPEVTSTAVPTGGNEPGAPKSRYSELFDRISKGQASEAENKEFNNLSEKQNTVTTWTTEKGEIRQLPQIEGLRVVNRVFDRDRGLEIVYVTKENNRFNLKEGQVAGIFNPNVYDVDIKDGKEIKSQTGVVTLRSEVLKTLLKDKQSPSINVWLPIFVDATITNTNNDRTILIQESKMPSGREIIAFRVPIGSKLVLGLNNNQERSEIGFRPASANGGLIAIRSPRIRDRFELDLHYYGTFKKNDVKLTIGDDLLEISKRPFSDEVAEAGVAKFLPPIFNSVNLYMYALQSYSEKDGDFPEFPLGKKDLARIGGSFVAVMSNTNPLLVSSH